MNTSKIYLFSILLVSILIVSTGCEEKDEKDANEKPTVSFSEPANNLVVSNDTLISFVAQPYDKDGTIEKVVFAVNGTDVHTVVTAPYTFEWSIFTEANAGINVIKATAFDNRGGTGESEITIDVRSYLSDYTGIYEGTSYHWTQYPQIIDGNMQIVTFDSYKSVRVVVEPSSQDSSLDFTITYNDSIIDTREGLDFSASGIHSSMWGQGSSSGTLDISFENDSLDYVYTQKCGIPCNSGIEFSIAKN